MSRAYLSPSKRESAEMYRVPTHSAMVGLKRDLSSRDTSA